MLNPKNNTAKAMELLKIASSPRPSAPTMRVMMIEEPKAISVLIIWAPKVNDMLFFMDKLYYSIYIFLFDAKLKNKTLVN